MWVERPNPKTCATHVKAETAAYAIKTADHRRDVLSAIGDLSSSYCLRRWYVDELPELPADEPPIYMVPALPLLEHQRPFERGQGVRAVGRASGFFSPS
jgi:hypothetical protein